MKPRDSKDKADWLTLGEASRLLGVHEATLRHWADQGAVPFFRTPGGHRRFVLRDLEAFLSQAHPFPTQEKYLQAVLQQTHDTLTSGQVAAEKWYRSFSEREREEKRSTGRRLLGLLMQFLSHGGKEKEKTLEEARALVREYGIDAAHRGLSAQEMAKAFLFFRDFLVESAFQTPEEGISARGQRTYLQLNLFLNELLLAMLAGYEEARP